MCEGITEYQMRQFCLQLRADMIELKTFVKLAARKPSERIEEEWLNSRQVMRLLRINKVTLQKYRDQGRLPYCHLFGKLYYKSSDVEALLKSNYRNVNNKK